MSEKFRINPVPTLVLIGEPYVKNAGFAASPVLILSMYASVCSKFILRLLHYSGFTYESSHLSRASSYSDCRQQK